MTAKNSRPEPADATDQTDRTNQQGEQEPKPDGTGSPDTAGSGPAEAEAADDGALAEPADFLPLPTWPPDAYARVVDGPGANKLSGSSVAPLVAAARGYRHAEEPDAPIIGEMLRLGAKNSAKYRSMTGVLQDGGGAMLMPRYKPAAAAQYVEERGQKPFIDIGEFKPVFRLPDPDDPEGDGLKYKTLRGDRPVLDVHPATPPEWLDHTPVVLITEGVLKGDSGLTGLLRRAGISDDDLAGVPTNADGTVNQPSAVDKLRRLMRSVPADKQVLFISLGGVTNWHSNSEWNDINLSGRTVWVAFDGDVSGNRNVHREASKLWRHLKSKKARPAWLDLTVVRGDDGTEKQPGLDDYLAEIGPWETLPRLLKKTLPDQPAGAGNEDVQVDDWWVDEKTATAQVKRRTVDRNTGAYRITWEQGAAIVGRVVSMVDIRSADDVEVRTATISEDPPDRTDVTIEVYWIDPDTGKRVVSQVTGPDDILVEPPSEWHKPRVGASIPAAVKQHPDWPPPLKWLQAVKANRRDETTASMRWAHMGWVPAETPGDPVFIVGRQAVGREGFTDRGLAGITDRELDGASMFGVAEPEDDDELRDNIEDVLDVFGAVWKDHRYGTAMLAAALRPTVPLVSNTPWSLIGSRGTAKSWSAAAAMQFWQPRPGCWSNNRLPGSATDTATSTELAISRTPIWVVDDLAPSPDERAEKQEARKLDATIRAVYNRTAKRRSNADMGSRATFIPRAVLLVTGENNRFTASAESRYILLSFSKNSLNDEMHLLTEMGQESVAAATITFAMLRMFASRSCVIEPDASSPTGFRPAQDQTWGRMIETLEGQRKRYLKLAQDAMPSATERAWGTAADMCLGLYGLEILCTLVGLPDRAEQVRGMYPHIISLVSQHLEGQSERAPGASILQAVRGVLRAGQAHITAADTPGSSPIVGEHNSGFTASRIGWLPDGEGGLRPGGPSIGYLLKADSDDPVVLLDPRNAFSIAAKYNRDIVLFGQTANQSWNSAWDEGLTCPDGDPWKRLAVKGHKRPTVRAMVSGQSMTGVPVRLSTILSDDIGPGDDATEDGATATGEATSG